MTNSGRRGRRTSENFLEAMTFRLDFEGKGAVYCKSKTTAVTNRKKLKNNECVGWRVVWWVMGCRALPPPNPATS